MSEPVVYHWSSIAHEYFECICDSNEHLVRVNYFVDEIFDREEDGIYIDLHLNGYYPWHKRIWYALKYIFGYHCKYGHWDCWNLKRQDAERFRDLLDRYINSHKVVVGPMQPHIVRLSDGRRIWVLDESDVPEKIKSTKKPV